MSPTDGLRDRKEYGILIGDFEKDQTVSRVIAKLSGYRDNGTPYQFGRDIQRLIDSAHFSHSHHSRMLQLADCYTWFLQLCH